jgi:hypothetical protein
MYLLSALSLHFFFKEGGGSPTSLCWSGRYSRLRCQANAEHGYRWLKGEAVMGVFALQKGHQLNSITPKDST